MKRRAIQVVFVIALINAVFYMGFILGGGGKSAANIAPTTKSVSSDKTPDIQSLWTLTNDNRVAAGLTPLRLDSGLNKSAQARCGDMVERHYWSHVDPDGQKAWGVIANYYESYVTAGENLTLGYVTSEAVVSGWMSSPTHKANILNDAFADVGFGICYAKDIPQYKDGIIVVQHFASKQ